MYTEKDISLIIPYLKEELPAKEYDRISALVEQDPAFKAEVEFEKELLFATEMSYLSEMSSKIDASADKFEKQETKKTKIKYGLGVLALSAVVLGGFYIWNEQSGNVQALTHQEKIKTTIGEELSKNQQKEVDLPLTIESKEDIKKTLPVKKVIPIKSEEKELNQEVFSADLSKKYDNEVTNEVLDKDKSENNFKSKVEINLSEIEIENNEVNKPEDAKETKILCNNPKIDVQVKPSDYQEENGEILINSTGNLQFKAVNAENEFESFSSFYDLPSGKYKVSASDSLNCTYDLGTYTIEQNECVSKKSYVFDKSSSETWEIPSVGIELKTVQIKSITLGTVFEVDVHVSTGDLQWDGYTKSGELAPNGVYKVVVTTKNNKECKYNVQYIN